MKVNFIIPGLGDSGGIKVVYKYSKLLQSLNIDVKIYSAIFPLSLHKYSSPILNRIHQIYSFFKTFLFIKEKKQQGVTWVPKINDKYIRDADITIATAWPTAYQVNKLTTKGGKKAYFIQDYEVWDNETLGNRSYTLPLEHIVIAKWIDEILVNKLHAKPGYLVRNGIDTQTFTPAKEEKSSDHVSCLMLYHRLSKKGIKDGLNAYKIVKSKYSNVSLDMFGMFNDPKIPIVDHYYKDPSKKQLIKIYRQADIFIYPSREEGWGLTPLEAMACGCAVAGTKTGCMLELGYSSKNVLLSDPKDVKALADNIELLVGNKKLREKISENGRLTVENLSWNKSAEKLKAVFTKIVNS